MCDKPKCGQSVTIRNLHDMTKLCIMCVFVDVSLHNKINADIKKWCIPLKIKLYLFQNTKKKIYIKFKPQGYTLFVFYGEGSKQNHNFIKLTFNIIHLYFAVRS